MRYPPLLASRFTRPRDLHEGPFIICFSEYRLCGKRGEGSRIGPGELYLSPLPSTAVASRELLPWLAMRGTRPLSPMGLSTGKQELSHLITTALKRYERLLLWDLDGMERGRPNLELYRRFEGKGLWVDSGVESVDSFIDVIVGGAEVAVLNLRALPSLDQLREAGGMTEKLAVCVEDGDGVLTRDRRIRHMRPQDIFREALRAGVTKGIYLREAGLPEAPDWEEALEGMTLFSGPASSFGARKDRLQWRAVVDVYELI